MQPVSSKILFKHSLLLFQRKSKGNYFQFIPAIVFAFLFSQLKIIISQVSETKQYIWAYLFLAILLIIIISTVLYFRESSFELKSFTYVLLIGFRKMDVICIVLLRWLYNILIGYIIGVLVFTGMNLYGIGEMSLMEYLNIIGSTFILNFLLLLGVFLSIINFIKNNDK